MWREREPFSETYLVKKELFTGRELKRGHKGERHLQIQKTRAIVFRAINKNASNIRIIGLVSSPA